MMNKKFLVLPLVLALTACGTFSSKDQFDKRVEADRERQEKYVERAIDKSPKWMTELPKSNSAVFQNGTAVSRDMGMSVNKAKTMAYGKICMSAGGQVNQQSKIYRLDGENSSTENSELAIKSFCPGVDISGVEVVDTKMIAEGSSFRTYVLVALPTGEANTIQKAREERANRRAAETRSREAFKEMERDQVKVQQ
jgi:hypothetical protein